MIAHAARFAVLGGCAAGLGLAPHAGLPPPSAEPLLALAAAALGIALARPRESTPRAGRLVWACALFALVTAAALAAGTARLATIDAGALTAQAGERVSLRGFVEAVPRRSEGEVRVRVRTAEGRVLLSAPEPVGELAVGHEVAASGTVRDPQTWERGYLARLGIAGVVETERIAPTGRRRGGIAYLTDRLRERAEQALGRGTRAAEAALLRGFVLGEDDRIDPATIEDFQRSGLAHLLAVSGQNVLLLALLAIPILALAGVPLRARLVCVIALIAVYVPMAGAGASIQRAGVMGAAALVATLASRPTSRWYAMLLAAAATLALNPRAAADVGWQLSFAAVIGIALWTAPLRDLLRGAARARSVRAALAEAGAVTIAATVATAPLMAHHFDRLSLAALPANLLALPAVAPVMWLGMLSAAAGQLPWVPVEPLTWLAGLFAAYIVQTAHWFAAPGWSQVEIALPSPLAVAALYALLAVLAWSLFSHRALRRALRLRPPRRALALAAIALVAALVVVRSLAPPNDTAPAPAGLRATVLDVGEGDSILLAPIGADPVLVDTGPPGSGAVERLDALGVERLAAVVITHDQSDHAGALGELMARFEVGAVAFGETSGELLRTVRAAGVRPVQVAQGSTLASGRLRLEVLWPPRSRLTPPPAEDPNALSVVMLARWRHFEMLLTGDGEAEAVPSDPGPIDVLKVAHHGSEDAGLARLLERTAPRLAVISVGEDNPYGHPAPSTLAKLAEHGTPALRTDSSGELRLDVAPGGWGVSTGQ